MKNSVENASREDITFNSNIEMQSLKDAVWKLTTRVYLLEDFISGKFGEVLGNDGYTAAAHPEISKQKRQIKKVDHMTKIKAKAEGSIGGNLKRKRSTNQSCSRKLHINTSTPSESDTEDDGSNYENSRDEITTTNIVKNEMPLYDGNEMDSNDDNLIPFHDDNSGGENIVGDLIIPDCTLSENGSDVESTAAGTTTRTVFSKKDTPDFIVDLTANISSNADCDEEPVRLIKTSKGKPMLIDNDNHMYTLHKHHQNGSTSWRCVKYWSIRCKGSAHSRGNNILKSRITHHNHVADVAEMKTRILKLKLASAAQNTSTSSSKIIESILAEEPSVAVKNLLPTVQSLKSSLRKIRRKSKIQSGETMIASLINPDTLHTT